MAGRSSAWPRIKAAMDDGRIAKWVSGGMLEMDVAKALGVGKSTWFKYKAASAELRELVEKATQPLVREIESALVKKARGYEYTEVKTTTRTDADGAVTVTREEWTRYAGPDTGACIFILKNKAKETWQNDPTTADIRRRELDLRERIADGRGELWDD